jgi:hypothetical protein
MHARTKVLQRSNKATYLSYSKEKEQETRTNHRLSWNVYENITASRPTKKKKKKKNTEGEQKHASRGRHVPPASALTDQLLACLLRAHSSDVFRECDFLLEKHSFFFVQFFFTRIGIICSLVRLFVCSFVPFFMTPARSFRKRDLAPSSCSIAQGHDRQHCRQPKEKQSDFLYKKTFLVKL